MAAMGADGVRAVTVNPGGVSVTLSPWLIHTGRAPPAPSCTGARNWLSALTSTTA